MAKEDAIAELKSGLLAKFGEDELAQTLISREVTSLLTTKKTIQVADLTALETTLVQELGLPRLRRKRRVTVKEKSNREGSARQQSMTPVAGSKRNNDSLNNFSVRQEHQGNRSYSSDDRHRPIDTRRTIPKVRNLVTVTSGKRTFKLPSPNSLFPKLDEIGVFSTPCNRKPSPESTKNMSPLDHGRPEELRFRGISCTRKRTSQLDSWGQVVRWDVAKYTLEQEAGKTYKREGKKRYKEELDAQLDSRKHRNQSLFKAESSQDKTNISADLQVFHAERSQKLAKTLTLAQNQAAELARQVAEKTEKAAIEQKQNELEKAFLQEAVDRAEQTKAKLLDARKAHLLSLKRFQMQAAHALSADRKTRQIYSRQREKSHIEKDLQTHEMEEMIKKEANLRKERQIFEENRLMALAQKEKNVETEPVPELKLFEEDDERVEKAKLMQAQTLEVLARQRQEQARKNEDCKETMQAQADLWAKQDQIDEKDDFRLKETRKKQLLDLKTQLLHQIEVKKKRKTDELSFSPVEKQMNRALIEASSPFR